MILKSFAKYTRKYISQSVFFNKLSGLQPTNLLKKKLQHKCFPVSFAKS